MSDGPKRYAIVGVGQRSYMFHKALTETHKPYGRLVAVCDANPGRSERAVGKAAEAGCPDVTAYRHTQFERMIAETRPDTVIVTTIDCFHDEYICRALAAGCDAITEKPMTTEAAKCRRILDAAAATGREVRVAFNYRYSPHRSQVKRMLDEGVIGRVLSVDFTWLLDTRHGADYYRRWHRNKANSGGLMVHKATHHFDLVNWWLQTVPEEVFAVGKRDFYTPQTAERLGLAGHGPRCRECPVAAECNFHLDLTEKQDHRELYLDCEQHDGYVRDRCVFGEDIDIEDTMNVTVRYRSGATMSYSLNSFTPWEGYRIAFNGAAGRLEQKCTETVYVSGDGRVPGQTVGAGTRITVFPHFASAYEVPVETADGGHGGGDDRLLDDLLLPVRPPDPLHRAADHLAGAYSILTGIAANHSIAAHRPIRIADLVAGLG